AGGSVGRGRDPSPGRGGDDDVEAGPVDPVRSRVGEQRDQWQQLGKATRPAMTQNQRDPRTLARALMYEMNRDPADPRQVMGEPVQPPLGRRPVESVGPVSEQPFQPI